MYLQLNIPSTLKAMHESLFSHSKLQHKAYSMHVMVPSSLFFLLTSLLLLPPSLPPSLLLFPSPFSFLSLSSSSPLPFPYPFLLLSPLPFPLPPSSLPLTISNFVASSFDYFDERIDSLISTCVDELMSQGFKR